jgi:hypothetical protein
MIECNASTHTLAAVLLTLQSLHSNSHAQRRELHAGMLAMDDELNTPMGDRSRSTATLHSTDNTNNNTNTTAISSSSGTNRDVVNDVITALTANSSSAEDDACVDANDDVQSESDNDSTNGGDGDDGDAPQFQEDELVPTKNSPPPTRQSDSPTAVLKAARAYAVQQQLQRDSAAAGATAGTIVLASQSAAAAVTATAKLAVKRGGSSRWLATTSEGMTNGANTNTGVLRSGSLPLAHNSNSSNNSSTSDIVALAVRPAVSLQSQLYANDVLPQLQNADTLRLDSSGSNSSSRRSSKGSSDDLKLLRHSFDVNSLQAGSSKSNTSSSSGRGVRASAATRLKEHKLLGATR